MRNRLPAVSRHPAYSVKFTFTGLQFLIDSSTAIALLDVNVEARVLLALRAMDDERPTCAAVTGHQYRSILLWPLSPGDDAPAVIGWTAIVQVNCIAHANPALPLRPALAPRDDVIEMQVLV